MSESSTRPTCPGCGQAIGSTACRCLSCGWALTACYFGVVGLLLPMLGFFFAVPAIGCALVALLRKRHELLAGKSPRDIHPLLGLVFGVVGMLTWGSVWALLLRKGLP